jgi:CPA2 family monovalent cation:H+ antiporter-2
MTETHHQYQTLAQLQHAARVMELTWVTLAAESPLVGRTIRELDIRGQTGASVVGVMRAGLLHPNPEVTYGFAPGDLVAVMGNSQQLEAFQSLAHAYASA